MDVEQNALVNLKLLARHTNQTQEAPSTETFPSLTRNWNDFLSEWFMSWSNDCT